MSLISSGNHALPGRLKQFQALNKLLQRDYWYGIWAIQEVNSASPAAVHCGPDAVGMEGLSLVQEAFLNSQKALASITLNDPSFKDFRATMHLRGAYKLNILEKKSSLEYHILFEAMACHKISTLESLWRHKIQGCLITSIFCQALCDLATDTNGVVSITMSFPRTSP